MALSAASAHSGGFWAGQPWLISAYLAKQVSGLYTGSRGTAGVAAEVSLGWQTAQKETPVPRLRFPSPGSKLRGSEDHTRASAGVSHQELNKGDGLPRLVQQ